LSRVSIHSMQSAILFYHFCLYVCPLQCVVSKQMNIVNIFRRLPGWESLRFSTEIAVCLRNGKIRGYYGSLTGRRRLPIDVASLSDLERPDPRGPFLQRLSVPTLVPIDIERTNLTK